MRYLLIGVLVFAACESTGDDQGGTGGTGAPVTQGCARRTGLYRGTYATRDGNCGAIPEAIVNLDNEESLRGCTLRKPLDRDSCTVYSDSSCPVTDPNYDTLDVIGRMDWNASATRGTGTVQMTARKAGAIVCTGTYNLTMTKL